MRKPQKDLIAYFYRQWKILSDANEQRTMRNKTLDFNFKGGVVTTHDNVYYFNKLYYKSYTYKTLDEPLSNKPIVIYFQKKSFLVESFNDKIHLYKSAGLTIHWIDKYLRPEFTKIKDAKPGPKKMTVSTLMGPFQLVVLGWILSILVFMIEKIINKFRKRKVRGSTELIMRIYLP